MMKHESLENQKDQQTPKPVGEPFVLQLMNDGGVQVTGPVDMNPIGILDIFSKAIQGLSQHHAGKIREKESSRIVKPYGVGIKKLQ